MASSLESLGGRLLYPQTSVSSERRNSLVLIPAPCKPQPATSSQIVAPGSPQVQKAQPKPKTTSSRSTKEPTTKKRKQVRKACVPCRRAHAGCDETRPCKRCVRLGIQDCVDHVRKKRRYFRCQPTPPEKHSAFKPPPYDSNSVQDASRPQNYAGNNFLSSPQTFTAAQLKEIIDPINAKVANIYRDLMTLKTELQRERQKSHQLELKVLDLEERSFNAPEDLAKAKWRISNRMLVEYTPKFKSMLGYSKERLDNFSCHDLFPPDFQPFADRCYQQMRNMLDQGIPATLTTEMLFVTNKGDIVHVGVTCNIENQEGLPVYYVMTIKFIGLPNAAQVNRIVAGEADIFRQYLMEGDTPGNM